MPRGPRSLALLGVVIAAASVAGTPSSPVPAEPLPRPVPTVEKIEVRLAQIDVVVRDSKGRMVTGLLPKDFKVFEDGVEIEVVAVDEWGVPAPAKPVPPGPRSPTPQPSTETPVATAPVPATAEAKSEQRSFIIVFDGLGDSTALRMSQARAAATKFIRTHLRPTDVAAVYQMDLSLRAVSGVTSDPEQITRAISKVAWMPASSLADQISESVIAYANESNRGVVQERLANQSLNAGLMLDWQREHTYDQIRELTSVFAGLPGKRVLVLVSPGFPMTTTTDVRRSLGGFTPGFRELIRTLASHGVTVYSVDIGNDLAIGDTAEAIDWRVAVGKLGMDENVLTDLGLERALGTASASSRREFLGVIAAETGGRLLTATDLSRAFETVEEESSRFYRLSCRVPVTRDLNRYRRLVVKLDRPGYSVAGRKGRYSDITPLDRPATSAQASVESLDRYRPLAVRGAATPLPGSDARFNPVDVVLEVLGPVDIAADSSGSGALDLDIRIVARAADEIVARYERSITAKVKPEGLAAVRRAFRVEGRVELPPGIYQIQGTVRLANPAQLATWTGTVAVLPTSPGAAPTIRGPVLMDAESETPLLHRPQIDEAKDVFTLGAGRRILPIVSPSLETGKAILALFWLQGFPHEPGKPPSAEMSVRVLDATGRAVEAPSRIVYFMPDGAGNFRGMTSVDVSKLTAGPYALEIAAAPSAGTGAPVRRSLPFALEATSSSAGSP